MPTVSNIAVRPQNADIEDSGQLKIPPWKQEVEDIEAQQRQHLLPKDPVVEPEEIEQEDLEQEEDDLERSIALRGVDFCLEDNSEEEFQDGDGGSRGTTHAKISPSSIVYVGRRYTIPLCRPLERAGTPCSHIALNLTLRFPKEVVLYLTEVHKNLCPCDAGLRCDANSAICRKEAAPLCKDALLS
uniref:(California timema) hypothetical protein n=1 Tax=Timema californicum TaxID=61474 RepID=A0A7R9P9M3_TIMCA|nr:unnamed protein product [Timema californicum]